MCAYVHQPGKELPLWILETDAESIMKFRRMFSFPGFCTTGQRTVLQTTNPRNPMTSNKTGSDSAKQQQLLSIHASFSVPFVPVTVLYAKFFFFFLPYSGCWNSQIIGN